VEPGSPAKIMRGFKSERAVRAQNRYPLLLTARELRDGCSKTQDKWRTGLLQAGTAGSARFTVQMLVTRTFGICGGVAVKRPKVRIIAALLETLYGAEMTSLCLLAPSAFGPVAGFLADSGVEKTICRAALWTVPPIARTSPWLRRYR
jgi:hypothetical protein